MSEPPFDVKRAHRWFAVELNNLAWELVEADQRSKADEERMIHAAHGACFHWLEVGGILHHLRAECLLATVYAKANLPAVAVLHAERGLALGAKAGDAQTAFDRATAHGCASAAYRIAGRADDAAVQHRLARIAAEHFDDASEKPVFERLYPAP